MRLNGVKLDDPEDSVIALVGRSGQHLQIELDQRRRVHRLLTTSRAVSMPAGVRVGQTQAQVAYRLGVSPDIDEFEEVVWSPPVCADGTPAEVNFTWTPVAGRFEANRPLEMTLRLSRIEMVRHDR